MKLNKGEKNRGNGERKEREDTTQKFFLFSGNKIKKNKTKLK